LAHKPSQKNIIVKKRKRPLRVYLNMTSMMDIFTIILVFLMKQFSAEGSIITPAKGLKLPNSSIEKAAQMSLSVVVSRIQIMVEDSTITKTVDVMDNIKEHPKDFLIGALYGELKKRAKYAEDMEVKYGKPFGREVFIQLDEALPFEMLTRVLYTCGQAGFPNTRLAVYRTGD
jgi:biopolymer transport protein ExbD